ncbi:MAG: hypothetical protein N2999_00670 [Proteobacteria bacterium]|nr:hypothetical protein [Pseudomonadota bacterium]
MSLLITYKEVLENMYGITYMIDKEGCLIDYGERNWNSFAISNDGEILTKKDNVIGKNLYDFISDEETRESYRKMNGLLFNGIMENIHFYYRCDAPEFRRDMKMCITPIKKDGEVKYLIYQSILLKETMRPPMNIFKNQDAQRERTSNIVTICSYCKNIKIPKSYDDSKSYIWVTPEKYYQLGGRESILLSHGICPLCYENIVLKFLPADTL